MDIQIVATDVDGTLLGPDHKLPKENLDTIKELKEEGKHVVIATGRPPQEVQSILDEIGIPLPIICANGAVILDEEKKEIAKDCLPIDDVRKVVELFEERGFYQEIYTSKGNFIKNYKDADSSNSRLYQIVETRPGGSLENLLAMFDRRIEQATLHLVGEYDEMFNIEEIEFYKIYAVNIDEKILMDTKEYIEENLKLATTSSWNDNIEINTRTASKGNALLTYANMLGVKREQTMAIGDFYNDVSMLKKAGVSVAMGNAPDEIKEICDYVTESNSESGWASAVRKFMLNNE